MSDRRRVFLGLVEVGGFLAGLREGLRTDGYDARLYTLIPHRFQYAADDDARPVRWARTTAGWRSAATGLRAGPAVVVDVVAKLLLVAWAAARFDAFVLAGPRPLFGFLELRVLRLLGKPVVCVFFGSDERPAYLNGGYVLRPGGLSPTQSLEVNRLLRRRVRQADRHASAVVSHPPSSHFHSRPVARLMTIGFPQPERRRPDDVRVVPRVLHAPSNPAAKGTALVRAAVEQARRCGVEIEYVELIGEPNETVIHELARSDLLIDDAWSDSPMAVLAAEAASVGTPTLLAGHAWEALAAIGEELPPAHRVHPDDLATELIALLRAPVRLRTLGEEAQAYVRDRWSPDAVASRITTLLFDVPPTSWMFDPGRLTYVDGAGAPRQVVQEAVAAVVAQLGPEALLVDDKPALRAALLVFAAETAEP